MITEHEEIKIRKGIQKVLESKRINGLIPQLPEDFSRSVYVTRNENMKDISMEIFQLLSSCISRHVR